MARDFIRDHKTAPKDAVHVATAVRVGIPLLDTFDGELVDHNGKIGEPP